MRRLIPVAIAQCLSGCNKNEVNPEVDNTVHLAGITGGGDIGSVASYWKDGIHTALGNVDPTVGSQVNSLDG